MKRRCLFSIMVVMLTVAPVCMGAGGVVGHDKDHDTMTRWDSYGHVVWQSGDVTHDAYQMEMGPDGFLYLGMWVDDRVAKIDPVTGDRITEVALQQVTITDRTWDINFGNDFDGDGIEDLYVAAGHNGAGDGYILSYGSASDYTGGSERVWIISDVVNRAVALDFGPDVSGDGFDDLWILDGDGNNSGNFMVVVNGQTGATLYTWSLSSLRAPKDVVIKDDRIYVTSSAAHDIVSFALDGTDETRELMGSDSPEYYVYQMQCGLDEKWYTANRFSGDWGGQQGGITQFDEDWTNGTTYYTLAGSNFTGIVAFPGGAFGPVPVDGKKVSDQTDTISWNNPEPNLPSGLISCDVYLTNDYPEYGEISSDPNAASRIDPNFLNYATQVVFDQTTNSLDLTGTSFWPLQFGDTMYWRVDTRDSSSPETGTAIGTVWRFVIDNSAPQVNAGDTIYIWLTDGTVDVAMAPTVSDDGKPNPPGAYTVLWEEVVDDPNVVINSPTVETTTVTITKTGTYELSLTADDSELSASDTVTVNIYTDACNAAKGVPGYTAFIGDLDDDCDVDLDDFAELAVDWMNSTALTSPLP